MQRENENSTVGIGKKKFALVSVVNKFNLAHNLLTPARRMHTLVLHHSGKLDILARDGEVLSEMK